MILTILSYIFVFLIGGFCGFITSAFCVAAHEAHKYEDEDGNLK